MTPEQLIDAIDSADPTQMRTLLLETLRQKITVSRSMATDLRKDSKDALRQADEFEKRALAFEEMRRALSGQ